MLHDCSTKTDCLPLVSVLATGGTIAGRATREGSVANYRPGVVEAEALLSAVPGLPSVARLRCRQVSNIGSEDMTAEVWFALSQAVVSEVADEAVAGVVVLHGTDTMEETAVFLDLLTLYGKPVVLTGAMRPADAVSADGPANLLAAARVAVSPAAAGRGVLVAMGQAIHRARGVCKADTFSPEAFVSPNGPEGRMVDGEPVFFRPSSGRGTLPTFTLAGLDTLPKVEILYGHADQTRTLVDAALAAGAWGIVHAGVGMGNIHKAVRPALAEAVAGGVTVVCASRVFSGPVPATERNRRDGFVAAGFLNPQKSRVLLQLALTRDGATSREIQAWFDGYGAE